MDCDMCGSNKGPFYRATVEGTTMIVCNNCKSYASEARIIREEPVVKKKKQQDSVINKTVVEEPEIIEVIVPDYASRIKRAREKLGLKQEELAKRIAEKESLIHSVESGHHEPSMDLARKLERILKIKLVETVRDDKPLSAPSNNSGRKNGPLTIGDLLLRKQS